MYRLLESLQEIAMYIATKHALLHYRHMIIARQKHTYSDRTTHMTQRWLVDCWTATDCDCNRFGWTLEITICAAVKTCDSVLQ